MVSLVRSTWLRSTRLVFRVASRFVALLRGVDIVVVLLHHPVERSGRRAGRQRRRRGAVAERTSQTVQFWIAEVERRLQSSDRSRRRVQGRAARVARARPTGQQASRRLRIVNHRRFNCIQPVVQRSARCLVGRHRQVVNRDRDAIRAVRVAQVFDFTRSGFRIAVRDRS